MDRALALSPGRYPQCDARRRRRVDRLVNLGNELIFHRHHPQARLPGRGGGGSLDRSCGDRRRPPRGGGPGGFAAPSLHSTVSSSAAARCYRTRPGLEPPLPPVPGLVGRMHACPMRCSASKPWRPPAVGHSQACSSLSTARVVTVRDRPSPGRSDAWGSRRSWPQTWCSRCPLTSETLTDWWLVPVSCGLPWLVRSSAPCRADPSATEPEDGHGSSARSDSDRSRPTTRLVASNGGADDLVHQQVAERMETPSESRRSSTCRCPWRSPVGRW